MIELIIMEIGMLMAFIVGYIFGISKDSKKENPIKRIKLHHEKKINEKEENRRKDELEITMANINNYDGTGANQRKYNN
jgi:hypothetical protein